MGVGFFENMRSGLFFGIMCNRINFLGACAMAPSLICTGPNFLENCAIGQTVWKQVHWVSPLRKDVRWVNFLERCNGLNRLDQCAMSSIVRKNGATDFSFWKS